MFRTAARPLALVAALAAAAALPAVARGQTARSLNRNVVILSGMGGKCLDAEGGGGGNGTRLIGYGCNGGTNQLFWFNANGTVNQRGKCLDVQGGLGRDGDQVVLWDCNGGRNQQWQLTNGRLVGINGKCLDLSGGARLWFQNQPAILYACNGQSNQTWYWGLQVAASRAASGARTIPSGAQGLITPVANPAALISQDGGGLVASGGGNLVASGGGNLVASGGGN